MAKKSKTIRVLEYGGEAAAALDACRAYLKQAVEFLNGRRREVPDVKAVVKAAFPSSSIRKARCEGEDALGTRLPFVACVIADDDEPSQVRSERYFDPWYFMAMRLLELPGGRFRFDRSKRAQYFYLAYAGRGKEGNHYLRRIIADTPWWSDTREDQTKSSHYDYRRATLRRIAKKDVWKLGHETRAHSRVRDDAVRFAVRLFKRQLGSRRKLPGLGLGVREYEALVKLSLEIADAMHEKVMLQPTRPEQPEI